MKTLKCPVCRDRIEVWEYYEKFEKLLVLHALSCGGRGTYPLVCRYSNKSGCIFHPGDGPKAIFSDMNLMSCAHCTTYWIVRGEYVRKGGW